MGKTRKKLAAEQLLFTPQYFRILLAVFGFWPFGNCFFFRRRTPTCDYIKSTNIRPGAPPFLVKAPEGGGWAAFPPRQNSTGPRPPKIQIRGERKPSDNSSAQLPSLPRTKAREPPWRKPRRTRTLEDHCTHFSLPPFMSRLSFSKWPPSFRARWWV